MFSRLVLVYGEKRWSHAQVKYFGREKVGSVDA